MTRTTDQAEPFREWCILELMGHRRLAGLVTEQQLGGASFIRLDVPGDNGSWKATQLYSPSSVYAITITTEELARKYALGNQPAPLTKWDLPQETDRPRIPYQEDFPNDDGGREEYTPWSTEDEDNVEDSR